MEYAVNINNHLRVTFKRKNVWCVISLLGTLKRWKHENLEILNTIVRIATLPSDSRHFRPSTAFSIQHRTLSSNFGQFRLLLGAFLWLAVTGKQIFLSTAWFASGSLRQDRFVSQKYKEIKNSKYISNISFIAFNRLLLNQDLIHFFFVVLQSSIVTIVAFIYVCRLCREHMDQNQKKIP